MTPVLSQVDRRLLPEREVANIFTVTPRTVRRWANAGELTAIRIGGVTRYRENEILNVIAGEGMPLVLPQNEGRQVGNPDALQNSAGTGRHDTAYP